MCDQFNTRRISKIIVICITFITLSKFDLLFSVQIQLYESQKLCRTLQNFTETMNHRTLLISFVQFKNCNTHQRKGLKEKNLCMLPAFILSLYLNSIRAKEMDAVLTQVHTFLFRQYNTFYMGGVEHEVWKKEFFSKYKT